MTAASYVSMCPVSCPPPLFRMNLTCSPLHDCFPTAFPPLLAQSPIHHQPTEHLPTPADPSQVAAVQHMLLAQVQAGGGACSSGDDARKQLLPPLQGAVLAGPAARTRCCPMPLTPPPPLGHCAGAARGVDDPMAPPSALSLLATQVRR